VAFPAFLDACVLVPIRLADLLLRLAEAGTYRLLWSGQVLDEVERNLPKLGVPEANARRRVTLMRQTFPDALVTGYESLIESMTNHPKDRHVLAAAVRGDAAVIVTANIKDFPSDALKPYDIDAVHPDDFLLDQLDLYPARTLRCLREQIADYRKPEVTAQEFIERFARTAPRFADEVRSALRRS
jgi:predicted nucleic acid-binding protein